jgi:hypothetical protein
MDTVAKFINKGCFREALARLCRLALKLNPDKGHLQFIKDWEHHHNDDPEILEAARERLAIIDEKRLPPTAILTTEEITSDPILWLQAIDEHLKPISPGAYTNYLKKNYAVIHDGDGEAWVLPNSFAGSFGRYGKQFENLYFRLKHHKIIQRGNPDSIPVVVEGIPKGYHDWLSMAFEGSNFKIAIVHFEDTVTPEIEDREPSHFKCVRLSDEATRLSAVLNLIKQAKTDGIHVLVMPELTITSNLRDKITSEMLLKYKEYGENHELSVPIVVLGSFHEQSVKGWRNHSTGVLGLDGQTVFGADKRKSVTYSNKAEFLEYAMDFTCLSTPAGLMAITICKDLFDEGGPSTATLLKDLPLDWLLVPSMSTNINPHKGKAKSLFDTLGTIVAVANQEMPGEPACNGFIHYETCRESREGLFCITVKRVRADSLSDH